VTVPSCLSAPRSQRHGRRPVRQRLRQPVGAP
jgi:hypothetical protein